MPQSLSEYNFVSSSGFFSRLIVVFELVEGDGSAASDSVSAAAPWEEDARSGTRRDLRFWR